MNQEPKKHDFIELAQVDSKYHENGRFAPAHSHGSNALSAVGGGASGIGQFGMASASGFGSILSILRRRAMTILLVAFAGAALALLLALLIQPRYTAQAQMLVELPRTSLPAGTGVNLQQAVALAVDTHITLMTGRDHLRRVADVLVGDVATPRPAAIDRQPSSGTSGLLQRWTVWTDALLSKSPKGMVNTDDLLDGLKALQARRSGVVTVTFTDDSPERAAGIANLVIQEHVKNYHEARRALIEGDLARVDKRIAEQQKIAGTGRGQVYERLLAQRRELASQLDSVSPEVRLLAAARPPEKPSSANPLLLVVPAFLLFGIFGGWLALTMEQMDRTVRSSRDVEEGVAARCLGLIPPVGRGRRLNSGMLAGPSPAFAHSMDAVSAALQRRSGDRKPHNILVTSSIPGENKVTIAAGIAHRTARLDRRVLLIDFDPIARGDIANELVPRNGPTLADVVAGTVSREEAVASLGPLKFDVLLGQREGEHMLSFFGTERMSKLLEDLADDYDTIVINAPPVIGSAETQLMAPLADSIVLVAKWGATRHEVIRQGMRELRSATAGADDHSPDIGVIISGVDLAKHARYGFGDAGEQFVRHRNYYARKQVNGRS